MKLSDINWHLNDSKSPVAESTDFRKDDRVKDARTGEKGTVLHKGNRDEVVVKFGSLNKSLPASQLRLVDEGEKHGNSKVYDKCWDGYKKVPGKKRGEKGSCVKETELAEGPLVLNRPSDVLRMLDSLLDGWKSKEHSEEELAKLLQALGYKMDKKGDRTVLVQEAFKNTYDVGDRVDGPLGTGTIVAVSKNVNIDGKVKVKLDDPSKAGKDGEDKDSFVLRTTDITHIDELEEAPGAIRKGMAAVALIAGLWGVNNQLAQQAYDASPQLQKLTAYLEVAKEHNDQRMINQLEARIEAHKLRLDLGKGDVMGKDGRAIDVVYDKEK
jgi:hypothetical protein